MSGYDIGPTRGIRPEERTDIAPPSVAEFYNATWNEQRKAANFDAHLYNYFDAYQSVNERIKAATGVDIGNPMSGQADPAADVEKLFAFSRETVGKLSVVDKWKQEVAGLKAKHPDVLAWDDLLAEPDRVAWEAMRTARETAGAMGERIGLAQPENVPGIGKIPVVGPLLGALPTLAYNAVTHPQYTAAQLVASLDAQMRSPADAAVNAISFGVGGAAKSLVKNALQNAAANAAGQALLSMPKQASYQSAGLPHGLEVWANEVAGAAGGGFAVDLAVRAPARALLSRYGRDVAPGQMFSRNTERAGFLRDLEDPEGLKEVRAALQKAEAGDLTATREILKKSGALDDPSIKYALDKIEATGKLDAAARQALEEMNIPIGEGMRQLAAAIEGKPTRMPDTIARATQQLLPAEGAKLLDGAFPVLATLPERIAQAVHDGLEAGMPRIVEAARRADGEAREAVAARVAAIMDERTMAQARMLGGRGSSLEMAADIRRWPDIIDTNIPIEAERVAIARQIARLDDGAYEAVVDGAVPPAVAAMISERLLPEHHMQAIEDLAKVKPASMSDAAAALEVVTPVERIARTPQQGLADPAGPEAKAQVEILKKEAGASYEAAVAPILRRQAVESRIEDLKGEIAKADLEAERNTAFADPDTGTPVERAEVEAIVGTWRYVREMRSVRPPKSIVDFVRGLGGIIDETGDVVHRMGDNKQRPGLRNKNGLDPDEVTLRAWEAGYLGSGERPGINALYDAIGEDLSGNRVYSEADFDVASKLALAREMEAELDQRGLAKLKRKADVVERFARAGRQRVAGDEAAQRAAQGAADERAARQTELRQLQRELAKLKKKTPEPDAPPLHADMEEVAQLGVMAQLIEACR